MDHSVWLAGVKFEHPIMAAACDCKIMEDVQRLARSASASVAIGSITMQPRTGNPGETYFNDGLRSLNSRGLPNPGIEYWINELPKAVAIARTLGKPIFFSCAGFTPEEYVNLAEAAVFGGADFTELNFGCPNVWQGSAQKPIVSFQPDLMEEVLQRITASVGHRATIAVKLSPFSDPISLARAAEVLRKFSIVWLVITSNTFPNAFLMDEGGKSVIDGEGLAGMAGPAMKAVGLGQVLQLRKLLRDDQQIIGVGGIRTGQDVLDYLRAGASAVQVGTAYIQRREHVFTLLLTEYLALLEAAEPAVK